MIKKLDIYIIKKFLATFFFILSAIMMIAVVFDVSEKIDDFIKHDPTLGEIIFDYYLNFVIYFGNLFSPLLIFISVIFFTSKMASNSEIVAILNGGVSFNRMLRPYFIASTLLALTALVLNHWIIPHANRDRIAFEELYIRSPYRNFERDIHKMVKPDEFIYFESYNADKDIGQKFSYEIWEDGRLIKKILGDQAKWDTSTNQWIIRNYQTRIFDGEKELVVEGPKLMDGFNFSPEDLERRIDSDTQVMDYDQLNDYIDKKRKEGSQYVAYYEIEKHTRSSLPFSTYILTLIGVSVSSRKVRGGLGVHLAFGLLVAVTYIMSMKVSSVYATNAGVNAFIATWIPNIIFTFLSIYIFTRAPK